MKKSVFLLSALALGVMTSAFAEDENPQEQSENMVSETFVVSQSKESKDKEIPCPFGWSVMPNPSLENSLTYLDAENQIAVSVTSIEKESELLTSPETYARVASEQMMCEVPSRSNLIEDAWSFECPKDKLEVAVYGDKDQLVLLTIKGRNANTEAKLENFVKFLAYEAKKRS
ncbi:MAG: hypothetical protein SPK02_08215 [Succinivibrio sp.]|nr:hypothetical protein [Succinivibrio sp.]